MQQILSDVCVLVSSVRSSCSRAFPLVGTRPRRICSRNAVVLVRVRLESLAAAGGSACGRPPTATRLPVGHNVLGLAREGQKAVAKGQPGDYITLLMRILHKCNVRHMNYRIIRGESQESAWTSPLLLSLCQGNLHCFTLLGKHKASYHLPASPQPGS